MAAGLHVRFNGFGGYDERSLNNGSYASDCSGFTVTSDGVLKKSPSFTVFRDTTLNITGMWSGTLGGRALLVYTAGSSLYSYDAETEEFALVGYVGPSKPTMFLFDGFLYILNAQNYCKFDGTSLSSVSGYVPLIAVSTEPAGGGTQYEAVNLLTASRRQQFSADGTSLLYRLAESGISAVTSVTINGSIVSASSYTVSAADGTVSFATPPAAGLNNVEITYTVTSSSRADLLACKYSALFGSNADIRVFLWGDASKPCYRYHSELADGVPSAEYFPANAYTVIGNTAITDIVQLYDKQLIFTANAAYYSYCEIRTSITGSTYASFPVYPLNASKGNMISGSGCIIDGMPVTLCADGLNVWQSTAVEDEKNAVCFSEAASDYLRTAVSGGYSNLFLFSDIENGELYTVLGNSILVYNWGRKAWYKLGGITPICMCKAFGNLYFGADNKKIYVLSGSSALHAAYYTAQLCDFGRTSLKDIKKAVVTVKAGASTAGRVTATTNSREGSQSRTVSFSFPQSAEGKTLSVSIPLYIPAAESVSLRFDCPVGSDVEITGYELTAAEKGELPYEL